MLWRWFVFLEWKILLLPASPQAVSVSGILIAVRVGAIGIPAKMVALQTGIRAFGMMNAVQDGASSIHVSIHALS